MAHSIRYPVILEGGNFRPEDPITAAKKVKSLKDGKYVCVIQPYVDDRTLRQNAYIHVIIRWWNSCQKEYWGNDWNEEDAKFWFKLAIGFCKKVRGIGPKGEKTHFQPLETSALNKIEFSNLVDLARDWCLENWGSEPPLPEWKWEER